MPVNRNALIRYKTIDNCLRNRYRTWTLEDLIEACSDALYEYEGIDKGVSRRTIQLDIQIMRSEKLGYHAPIEVVDKKYYTYTDPEYSITNIPLTEQDLGKLSEVVDILKQFKGFSHFQELSGMVQKLEDKIHVSKTHDRAIIDMEKNENLRGLEFIDPLYQAIQNRKVVKITYKSFKARSSQVIRFHPVLLKEFRNRWFVLGMTKPHLPPQLLALDRIDGTEITSDDVMEFEPSLQNGYFKDVIGATVNLGEEPMEVILAFTQKHAPYVLTKPLHHSQEMLEKTNSGIVVSLRVQHNFELEKSILEFGDGVRVISPLRLKRRIKERLQHAIDAYDSELNPKLIENLPNRLKYKGTAIISHVFTRKSMHQMSKRLHNYLKSKNLNPGATHAIRELLIDIPELASYLFNQNLIKIIQAISPNAFLTRATYFNKPMDKNWYVTWHQDTSVHVTEKTDTPGFHGWTRKGIGYGVVPPEEVLMNNFAIRIHLDETSELNGALKVLPGSHSKIFSDDQIELLSSNALPQVCEVGAGGIHIMHPLLLHSSSLSKSQHNRRVIHLEFSSYQLPIGMDWAEKLVIQ